VQTPESHDNIVDETNGAFLKLKEALKSAQIHVVFSWVEMGLKFNPSFFSVSNQSIVL
jgi:hypothetical protein